MPAGAAFAKNPHRRPSNSITPHILQHTTGRDRSQTRLSTGRNRFQHRSNPQIALTRPRPAISATAQRRRTPQTRFPQGRRRRQPSAATRRPRLQYRRIAFGRLPERLPATTTA